MNHYESLIRYKVGQYLPSYKQTIIAPATFNTFTHSQIYCILTARGNYKIALQLDCRFSDWYCSGSTTANYATENQQSQILITRCIYDIAQIIQGKK